MIQFNCGPDWQEENMCKQNRGDDRCLLFFCTKNNTFIQVFSSTSTYGALFFSLDTKHKYSWGVGGLRWEGLKVENGCYICCLNWSWEKAKSSYVNRESHTERLQHHPIEHHWPSWTVTFLKCCFCYLKKEKEKEKKKINKEQSRDRFKTTSQGTDMENSTAWNVGLKSDAY